MKNYLKILGVCGLLLSTSSQGSSDTSDILNRAADEGRAVSCHCSDEEVYNDFWTTISAWIDPPTLAHTLGRLYRYFRNIPEEYQQP
jgi:hypothetical protein